jgi:hypothetical protein
MTGAFKESTIKDENQLELFPSEKKPKKPKKQKAVNTKKRLILRMCELEGGKKQIDVAQMSEALKVLRGLIKDDPAVLLLLLPTDSDRENFFYGILRALTRR